MFLCQHYLYHQLIGLWLMISLAPVHQNHCIIFTTVMFVKVRIGAVRIRFVGIATVGIETCTLDIL